MSSIASGVWPTMVTPFKETGKIDYIGVEKILRFYADNGVAGVFAVCQSSEMFHLSLKERQELAAFISNNLPKGMQMIVSGHTADAVDEQIREAYEIMCRGAYAYVVLPNRFAAEEETEDSLLLKLEQFIKGFDTAPLGMYECPFPYKRLLSERVLKYCVDSGRFHFIKDTCCSPAMIKKKLDLIAGTGMKLFNANSATLLKSLEMGAAGFSGVMANIHPEFYVWLCENFSTQPDKALKVQQYLGAASMAEYQFYPVNAKYALGLRGVPLHLLSRTKDSDLFAESQRLEMEHFVKHSAFMAEAFAIKKLQKI